MNDKQVSTTIGLKPVTEGLEFTIASGLMQALGREGKRLHALQRAVAEVFNTSIELARALVTAMARPTPGACTWCWIV